MKIYRMLIVVAVLLLVTVGVVAAGPPPTNFASIRVDHNASVGADLSVGDDLSVTDDLAVTDDAAVGGDLTVTGSATYGSMSLGDAEVIGTLNVSDTATFTGAVTVGVDGTGNDVTFYSDTAGDTFLWDESAEALILTGTNGQDALDVEDGNVDIADDLDVDGTTNLDAVDIDDAVNITGKVYQTAVADADADNYDYMHYIGYYMTGTGTKDRNYGLFIEGTRQAGQEVSSGDFDEAGLKIRVDTEAITTTTGTVLRGADIEAKADNPDGTSYNIYGAAITAKSDTSAGTVGGDMIALTTNAQNNAEVTTSLMSIDARLMRQAATAPTNEYVVRVRNSSTSGTGADAAIYVASDYESSATTDAFDYGIDFNGAAVTTAEIRLQNEETIDNTVDGTIAMTGIVDVSGELQYGANDLYAVGYASSGTAIVAGVTATFTGTVEVASGLTSVTSVVCGPAEAPAAVSATCWGSASGATVTLHSLKADGVTEGDVGTTVYYQIIGVK